MDPFLFLAISFLAAMLLASVALSLACYVVSQTLEGIWGLIQMFIKSHPLQG